MGALLTYVYCLVRSRRRPPLRNVPPAMPGGDGVDALDAGDGLWVIVSHVPADEYDEAAIARGLQQIPWVGRLALAHEAVIEHFLGAPAVLPMQLFTLFTSDERALAHVSAHRRRLERVLSRIERQLEWGLRLTFSEAAPPAGAAPDRQSTSKRAAPRKGESGAAYLSRKRDLVQATRMRLVKARTEGDRVYRALAREATSAMRRNTLEEAAPGSRLLVDAAFLVPVGRTAAFRAALRRQAKALGSSGLVVSLTGPWPPYNFIDPPPKRRQS